MGTVHKIAGLIVVSNRCVKCGSPMYLKPAPCFMKKRGWASCIRCIRCGYTEGYKMKKKKR